MTVADAAAQEVRKFPLPAHFLHDSFAEENGSRNAVCLNTALTHIQVASVTEVDAVADVAVVVPQAEAVLAVDVAVLLVQEVVQRPLSCVQTKHTEHFEPVSNISTGAPQTRRRLHRPWQGGHVGHQVHGPRCRSLRREACHH